MLSCMPFFGGPTRSERDQNMIVKLERDLQEVRRELDAAQRRIDAVDLHARAIVEEAKRLINKFERRLDREDQSGSKTLQDASGRTNTRQLRVGDALPPIEAPGPRRNY